MCSLNVFTALIAWLVLLQGIVSTVTNAPTAAPTGSSKIYTAAGSGSTTYSGDGASATLAGINGPLGIVIDSSGNYYISDQNHRVRKVTASTGIISTYVGTGTGYFSGDGGQATSATIKTPYGLGIDSSDNLYIADSKNNRIRKVTASTGIITTIAGTGGTGTVVEIIDNIAATSSMLYTPQGVALDSSGTNIIISLLLS